MALLKKVLRHDDALNLIGAFVDLGVPAGSSAPSAEPVIDRIIVH
jgi:hypothetical protein